MQQYLFKTQFARRLPDPVHKDIEHHIMWVRAADLPSGMPLDANARTPKTNKRVYRDVELSLLDGRKNDDEIDHEIVPGTFHLKNSGITIVADTVSKISEGQYEVAISPGQGILNGGHTTEIILKNQKKDIPENYVLVSIRTHVPADWIPDMAGGLNTAVQVQAMSLDDLEGQFDWIKEAIKNEPFAKDIAWREGEDGEFTGRDIVAMLTCFNIDLFPNDNDESPIVAYEKKSAALEYYEQNRDSYEKLKPILKDILRFYDIVRSQFRDFYNEEGGRGGGLAFVDKKVSGYAMPFIGGTSQHRLSAGALYPIFGAFRWMVELDPSGKKFRWRGGDFENVLHLWSQSAAELVRLTKQVSDELYRRPNAIGKSRSHWSNLHARVAKREMELQRAKV